MYSFPGAWVMPTPRLAIVDDDQDFCALVAGMARRRGISSVGLHTVRHAVPWLEEHDPELLFLDLGLPDGNGLDMLERLSARPGRSGRVVVVTALGDQATLGRARACRPADCLLKPLPPSRLEEWLDRIGNGAAAAAAPVDPAWGLLGESVAMDRLRTEIARAGPSRMHVLVQGESGTGKELVASALHAASGRPGRFVAVNCGALPEELLASELFGHERGSFTGADRRHLGLVEQAAHGTLFLDEVGEMSPRLQVYLLRMIENARFTRVGGSEELPVTARIIAATHRSADPSAGFLRHDLYYRLAEYPIVVPPLRERLEDVPLLARRFAEEANREHGCDRELDPAWLGSLATHSWPGNVRQLRACVRRAFIASGGGPIRLEAGMESPLETVAAAAGDGVLVPAGATLREAEDILIDATLKRCGHNKTVAARALGITARTILNHLSRRREGDHE